MRLIFVILKLLRLLDISLTHSDVMSTEKRNHAQYDLDTCYTSNLFALWNMNSCLARLAFVYLYNKFRGKQIKCP